MTIDVLAHARRTFPRLLHVCLACVGTNPPDQPESREIVDARLYTRDVVEHESFVYERSFYVRLHSLRDDMSSPATLANRVRDAKALHSEEYTADGETDVLSSHGSGVPDESKQIDQLRSAIIQTRKTRAGLKLVMWLLAAVVVIALVLTATVSWVNF